MKLSGIGDSTTFWNAPEEVEQRLQAMRQKAAQTPPEPSDTDKKLAADAQKAQMQAQTDIQKQAMSDETDKVIQGMKDQIDIMQAQQEMMLAVMKAQQGERLNSNDVNLEG